MLCWKSHHAARDRGLPIILDAKRGDIASTAEAYCKAYLAPQRINGRAIEQIHADAITMNPFLGFDTVETFLKFCRDHGKGLFVLVKTSNPGSADIQGLKTRAAGDTSNGEALVMDGLLQPWPRWLLHSLGKADFLASVPLLELPTRRSTQTAEPDA